MVHRHPTAPDEHASRTPTSSLPHRLFAVRRAARTRPLGDCPLTVLGPVALGGWLEASILSVSASLRETDWLWFSPCPCPWSSHRESSLGTLRDAEGLFPLPLAGEGAPSHAPSTRKVRVRGSSLREELPEPGTQELPGMAPPPNLPRQGGGVVSDSLPDCITLSPVVGEGAASSERWTRKARVRGCSLCEEPPEQNPWESAAVGY